MRTEMSADDAAYKRLSEEQKLELSDWLRESMLAPEYVHAVRLVGEGQIEVLLCPYPCRDEPGWDKWETRSVDSPPPSVWFDSEEE